MSSINYENAVALVKSLVAAVEAIESREKQSREAHAKLSVVESAAREAESRRQDAHAKLSAVETQIAAKRDELARLTSEADQMYERRKSEEGRINAIRSEVISLQQKLGA